MSAVSLGINKKGHKANSAVTDRCNVARGVSGQTQTAGRSCWE